MLNEDNRQASTIDGWNSTTATRIEDKKIVDVKITKVQSGPDEIEFGFYMVTRMEVDPEDNHFVTVTLHYWESPEAAAWYPSEGSRNWV
jgi:hypothetical protein